MDKDSGRVSSSCDNPGEQGHHPCDRRDFLKGICALPIAVAAAQQASSVAAADKAEPKVPQVPFGKHTISRLVLGSNPFHAGSHLSTFVNNEMRTYYTLEQKLKTVRRCEEVGITLWQGSDNHNEVYRQLREQGSRMQYISLGQGGDNSEDYLKQLRAVGCLGVAHHGETTDGLFKRGELDKISDYLKRVRDTGMLVGVSTHMPAVVDAVESKGWDVDFYMTCVYERHRSAEDLKKLLGEVPVPVGEVYLQSDPPRMFKAIRQTKRTCFAFKILAAGRLSENKANVEKAFRETFAGIKPTDAVIIGIFDKYGDQPAEDAGYAKRFGGMSGKA